MRRRPLPNPMLAVVGNPGRSRGHDSVIHNVYTGELRRYRLNPAEATAQAHYEDTGIRYPVTGSMGGGHYRTGPWAGRDTRVRLNARPAEWPLTLLDTIHYVRTMLDGQTASGGSIASIRKSQWVKRFAPNESEDAQKKRWKRFRKALIDADEKKNYGILADRRQGWLDINVPNAYDAVWLEKPGTTMHPLGEQREEELIQRQLFLADQLPPGGTRADERRKWDQIRAQRSAFYTELDAEIEGDFARGQTESEIEAYWAEQAYLEELRRRSMWQEGFEREDDYLLTSAYDYEIPEFQAEVASELIPGGSWAAYEQIKRRIRDEVMPGQLPQEELAAGQHSGSVGGVRSNPQERVAKRVPKERVYDVSECEQYEGYEEARKKFLKAHGHEPANCTLVEVPGDENEVYPVHAYLHDVYSLTYTVPVGMRESSKHQGANNDLYRGTPENEPGLWEHKHFQGRRKGKKVNYPMAIAHPFLDNVTIHVARGGVALGDGEWYES